MIAIIIYFIHRSRRLFHIGLSLVSLCLLLSTGALCAQETGSEPADDPPSAPATESASPAPRTGTLTVIVEGLDDLLRDNVLAFLDINQFAGKPTPEEIQLNWLHQRAEDEIRQALQPFGYFEPTIKASLSRVGSGWEARYRVQAGRPMRITHLDVQVLGAGAQDPSFQTLLANLPLTEGQVLDQLKYEQIKSIMGSLATERGYFDAHFTEHTIRVDLQAYTATVRLHYDTAQRYRFGNITFKQDFLSPELLSRYPSFKSGDPYNVNQLLKLQTDLSGATYFSRVEVNAPPSAGTNIAPVDVELEPGKRYQYSIGVGYGTDTGFRGKLGVEDHRVNRHGHHYKAELGYSEIKSLVGFQYLIPGDNPVTDEYAITAGYIQQNDDDKDYHTYKIGGSLQMQDGKWLKNYSLDLQYDEYTIGNRPTTEESLLLIPGVSWTWIDADDRTYPSRGLLFGFELRGATTALLS
ncbi:MAG: hypothetical protein KDI50_08895, partial [Candidatus Competibacteraceae bacterium]|nr:hypothetical protein [Candidatus Competibacteraceae bacterium]